MAADPLKRRPDGFLERGAQVTRVEAFVDAAFAFAVTVLVLRVFDEVETVGDLLHALKNLPGMLASFAIIVMFWWAHQTWSRRFGMDDGRSVLGSIALVFLVAVYCYPLQMMFQTAFGWMSRLILPPAAHLPFGVKFTVNNEVDEVSKMFVVYGVAWSTLSMVIVMLYRHAWHRRDELELNLEERVWTRAEIARWWWAALLGGLSLVLALILRPFANWMLGLPGMLYSAMGLTGVVMSIVARRVRPAIQAELERVGGDGSVQS